MFRFQRFLVISVISVALLISSCGFHLRNTLRFPENAPAIEVESVQRYSELTKLLQRSLRAAGAPVWDSASTNEALAGLEVARLMIHAERWGDLPIAMDSQGRTQEYRMRYAVIFSFLHPDGEPWVPQQALELSRDYISQPSDSTGINTERERLASELRREMAAAILQRIDSVVRAQFEEKDQEAPSDSVDKQ